jgi:hypothetical protein
MDMKAFHENFPSFEKQYQEDQRAKKRQEEDRRRVLFEAAFPSIPWSHLKRQNERIQTDDGCTHYIDTVHNGVYSWNFLENRWE